MKITIPYTPRKHQAYVHKELEKHRYAVLLCHRRFGKTTLCLLHLIKKCLTNKNFNPRYHYICPTYKMAKSIAWDFLKYYTKSIPQTKWNESELRCDFINNSRITLLSSENPDSIRGIYSDGVIVDETSQITSALIDEVITPSLSDRRGFMYMVGTPAGMNNILYEFYNKAQANDEWFLYKAKATETKILDQDELDAALKIMGTAKFNQEYECSFIGNLDGSIFGDIVSKMEDNKQLGRFPIDPSYPISTSWDLGWNDLCCIIFFQEIGGTIRIVDYYENRNQALPHYAKVLKEKDYVYDKTIFPHDIEQTEFTTGKTRRETAYQLGIKGKVAPRIPLVDGLHSVKMMLPKTFIDTDNCQKLINALRHYHQKYNDKQRVYHIKPVHDWSSHACDALRTLATGLFETDYFNKKRQLIAESNYEVI